MRISRFAAGSVLAFSLLSIGFFRASAGDASALVRVRLGKELDQKALAERDIEIVAVRPDGLADLAVDDEQLGWLSSLGVPVAILERATHAAPMDLDSNLGAYYTYAEMQASLDSLVYRFPQLTRIDTLGTSIEGRSIRAIKISDNSAVDEDEPEVFIFGCLHARELMSVEVPIRLAAYLLEHYGDPRIKAIVDTREVWIAPMINPDGHVYVEQNHSGASYTWWRKNRRMNGDGSYGVDLNRNFGYMWGYDNVGSSPTPSSAIYRGTAAFSEPETQAVRNFCAARSFSTALSYHSYSELILYPWDYDYLYTSDQELFSALGDSLSAGNGYLPGNPATGAIYLTNGGSDDWMYGDISTKNRIYSFTVELNSYEEGGFAPPENLIMPTFAKVLELNLRLLEYSDEPRKVLGPEKPEMNPIEPLNPPAYEISWRAFGGEDPNPAVAYDLLEYRNLGEAVDSCEVGDTLWTGDGFVLSQARYAAGVSSWYSGQGNDLRNKLTMASPYPVWFSSVFSCWLWYSIESDWDYAYLEVSTDGGATWNTAAGNRTTNYDPNGANRGNGITGSSNGWVLATWDLSGFLSGEKGFVLLRFSYETDSSVFNEGLYIDLAEPVPRCDRRTMLASGLDRNWFHRVPAELGTYHYQVRGADADGHRGKWSDFESWVVEDLSGSQAPRLASALSQNYPNPFNPATSIPFFVGTKGNESSLVRVRLELFDISGRRVAVLVDSELPAGEYEALWNGFSSDGREVASGIYLMRLEVSGEVFTRKLVLLR